MLALLLAMLAGEIMDTPQEPDTSQVERRSALLRETFNGLNKERLDILDEFYHPDVEFRDPLGAISGLENVRSYYANLYENVTAIHFEFTEEIVQDNTHVAIWIMRLEARKLNKGREIEVHGNSVIRFNDDDLVTYHRDYFDMGEFIYRRVPIVRWFVKKVDKRLQHKD